VLNHATQTDPADRPQNIDEFWIDMTELRRLVDNGEVITSVHSRREDASPQPHVARGYTPIAPMQPRFDTARNLQERFPAISAPQTTTLGRDTIAAAQPEIFDEALITNGPNGDIEPPDTVLSVPIEQMPMKKKRRVFRKMAAFVVVIGLFAGILFGTHAYLRNTGAWPNISNPFKAQTAIANTDIYLRPSPSTNNDPIGLVTKNSKVRIVKTQNNWYEVDVVEQGRERNDQPSATHGWLNGKYLDLN
jgi:hypothetical protein